VFDEEISTSGPLFEYDVSTRTLSVWVNHFVIYKSKRYHWGDLGVDGWIILGWIFRRWDMGLWTGLGWPRIGTGGGRL